MKYHEINFYGRRWSGGIAFYPHQTALGVSLRYWPCLDTPSICIYILCFELWLAFKFGGVSV